MKRFFYISLLLLLLTSCKDSNIGGISYLEIYLEDSPGDFNSATVKLESIEVLKSGAWKTLELKRSEIEVTQLTGGKSVLLAKDIVEGGTYTKVRLKFASTGNKIFTTVSQNLTIEEADRVVEIPVDLEMREGGNFIVCDIDVHESIDAPSLTFKPVITAIDMKAYGGITGALINVGTDDKESRIGQMMHVQINGEGLVKNTYSNISNGEFFVRVPDGIYEVMITPRTTSEFALTIISNIVVQNKECTIIKAIMEKKPKSDV